MRNAVLQLCLVVIGITSVHAVKLLQTSSIHAKVYPAEGVEKVWAIQGSDSVKMIGNDGDYYLTAVNPGHWRVRIDAKKPYRNVDFQPTNVGPGTFKDLGEIRLENKN